MTSTPADLAELCRQHLLEEEHLLDATLAIVERAQVQMASPEVAPMQLAAEAHEEVARLLQAMQARREQLSRTLAARLYPASASVKMGRLLELVDGQLREGLAEQLGKVRQRADQLVAASQRLALHLRIYLDTYQQLLCDLTRTAPPSGRYGPRGHACTPDYRPLIQLDG